VGVIQDGGLLVRLRVAISDGVATSDLRLRRVAFLVFDFMIPLNPALNLCSAGTDVFRVTTIFLDIDRQYSDNIGSEASFEPLIL
jgi:hypothetical protein